MTDEAGRYPILASTSPNMTSSRTALASMAGGIHVNTVEGFYSVFKRGMKGIYRHSAEKHLHRYVAEFDFRYNSRVELGVGDKGRTNKALRGIVGKRLTYKQPTPMIERQPLSSSDTRQIPRRAPCLLGFQCYTVLPAGIEPATAP